MENNKRIILISGMSGAGKSTATRILEDLGYLVIDNYPIELLNDLVDLIENTNDKRYDYIAITTSAADFELFLTGLKGQDIPVEVLFLDANDQTLLSRYKSTRRLHPLLLSNTCSTLEEAIKLERQMFTRIINNSFITIDTSYSTEKDFSQKIEKYFSKSVLPSFALSFVSFGFKYGVPMDADLMIDVRFLPNPYWEETLKHHSGEDEDVYHYVIDKEETQTFLKKFINFTDYAFGEYEKEGKNHFTVAIGCTGGQHRSVAVTNYLFDYYKDKYNCYKEHRDEKEWIK